MNIALEQTEEYVNGQLKNKYGDAFIRGNNGKVSSLYGGICSK
jgi:U6 snRNA-associated Sm-like protein LSm6